MVLPTIEECRSPLLPKHRPTQDYENDEDDDSGSDTTRVSATAPVAAAKLLLRNSSYEVPWSRSSSPQRRTNKTSDWLIWMRWTVVVILQATIIVLLTSPRLWRSNGETEAVLKGRTVETGDDINGLYRTESHSYTFLKPEEEKFIPNMTSNANREEVRKNWDMLMPLGSGSIAIPNYKSYPLLGDPITDDPLRQNGAIFEASWTHALHCLYYTVDSYHQLIVNGRSDKDNPYHAAHCFEYLRNGTFPAKTPRSNHGSIRLDKRTFANSTAQVLCSLDMTLEGSMSTPGDKERGQPHVCRNREEAVKWIEERRVDDFQDIVGPTGI